jgi:hypothetical protein
MLQQKRNAPSPDFPHDVASRVDTLSYLQPTVGSRFTAGQQFVTPDPKVFVWVVAIEYGTFQRDASGRKIGNSRRLSTKSKPNCRTARAGI